MTRTHPARLAADTNASIAAVCVVAVGPPNARLHGPIHRKQSSSSGTTSAAPARGCLLEERTRQGPRWMPRWRRAALHVVRLPPAAAIACSAAVSLPPWALDVVDEIAQVAKEHALEHEPVDARAAMW